MIKFSYGKAEGEATAPLKVDSGPYKGSVFRFNAITLNDDGESLSYSVDIEILLRVGIHIEQPDNLTLADFYENCCSVILMSILQESIDDYKSGDRR